jgi:hypothetical protein
LTYPIASFANLTSDDQGKMHRLSDSCCVGRIDRLDSDTEKNRSDLQLPLAATPKTLGLAGLKLGDQRPSFVNLRVRSVFRLAAFGTAPRHTKVETIEFHDRLDLDTWLIGKKVANTSQQVAVAS